VIPTDLPSCRRVLVVKPSSLGDIVHTLPLLACVRRGAPGADIRWLVNSTWAPLLRDHPLLDGVIEFPRERFRGLAAIPEWGKWYRGLEWRPDLALDVQGLLRSAVLARTARADRIIGYSDAREGANLLHDTVVDVRESRSPHAVDRYLTVLPYLGLERPGRLEFPLPPGTVPGRAEALPDRFVILHPFSRGKGKSLSRCQVERLVRSIESPVLVVGKASGVDLDLNLCAGDENWLNRTTLPELLWLLRRAQWVISVDSGPMHLAAAVNERVVAIHTWSDPAKVGPYPSTAWVWKSGRLSQVQDWKPGEGPSEFTDSSIAELSRLVNRSE